MMRALLSGVLCVALLGSAATANAEPRHREMNGGPHFGENRGGENRGGAFRDDRFRSPVFHGDRDGWRGGNWRHDWHDGRLGWWWVVGDFWAFYPEPVYPYPAYAYDNAPPPPPNAVWYHCANPQGYYPYVSRCDEPWQEVPATPR